VKFPQGLRKSRLVRSVQPTGKRKWLGPFGCVGRAPLTDHRLVFLAIAALIFVSILRVKP
jgi:hypothetical protein